MKIRLTKKLRRVVGHYFDLQSRKAHPLGEFDNAKRWTPHTPLECCQGIRTPSRSWPYSLLTHCRSSVHVASENGYDVRTLQAAIRRVKAERGGVS